MRWQYRCATIFTLTSAAKIHMMMNTTTFDRTTHTSVTKWVLNDGCGERNTGSVSYAANSSMPAPPTTPQSQCVFAQLGPRETSGWIDVGRMM